MQPHEYAIIGHSRAKIGRYLGLVAATISAAIFLFIGLAIALLEKTPLKDQIPEFIVIPISAAAIFGVTLWVFDTWMWRTKIISKLLKIPNIAGEWEVAGQTKNSQGETTYEWEGSICITQTWEKIKVRLKTSTSASISSAASLVNEQEHGYRLLYRYSNEPKAGEDLSSHVGFCELHFNKELTEADGDYFNNKGRVTFGCMKLKRKN